MRWFLVLGALCAIYIGYSLIDRFRPEMVSGKRVLITGASMGIGEGITYHYASMGAMIVITARSEDRLKKVINQCRHLGTADGKYHYIVADMSDMAATDRVVKEATEFLGGLDVLILNHVYPAPLRKWTGSALNFTVLERSLTVNARSYVHLASHALPHLKQSDGSIGVVSSVAGHIGVPYTACYSASKFALFGFFNSLRQELIMDEIDVSITLCTLGLIGTKNVLAVMEEGGESHVTKWVKPPSPTEAALAIVKGTALRERLIYFPLSARLITAPRDWFPELIEVLIRNTYSTIQ